MKKKEKKLSQNPSDLSIPEPSLLESLSTNDTPSQRYFLRLKRKYEKSLKNSECIATEYFFCLKHLFIVHDMELLFCSSDSPEIRNGTKPYLSEDGPCCIYC